MAVSAFEQTAQTIVQVGQQGVITSLLRSEANALRIESCNEVLTELISLFNVRPPSPGIWIEPPLTTARATSWKR